ncbi:Arc family DNA-binding protein [Chromohalobacter salexigens]|nr:Arc family DNA-binding protein [Chromohalobacter salexigens]
MPTSNQIHLRLPHGIKERLARQAKRNRRSLNAEIAYRLEQSLAQEEPTEQGGRPKK